MLSFTGTILEGDKGDDDDITGKSFGSEDPAPLSKFTETDCTVIVAASEPVRLLASRL